MAALGGSMTSYVSQDNLHAPTRATPNQARPNGFSTRSSIGRLSLSTSTQYPKAVPRARLRASDPPIPISSKYSKYFQGRVNELEASASGGRRHNPQPSSDDGGADPLNILPRTSAPIIVQDSDEDDRLFDNQLDTSAAGPSKITMPTKRPVYASASTTVIGEDINDAIDSFPSSAPALDLTKTRKNRMKPKASSPNKAPN